PPKIPTMPHTTASRFVPLLNLIVTLLFHQVTVNAIGLVGYFTARAPLRGSYSISDAALPAVQGKHDDNEGREHHLLIATGGAMTNKHGCKNSQDECTDDRPEVLARTTEDRAAKNDDDDTLKH